MANGTRSPVAVGLQQALEQPAADAVADPAGDGSSIGARA